MTSENRIELELTGLKFDGDKRTPSNVNLYQWSDSKTGLTKLSSREQFVYWVESGGTCYVKADDLKRYYCHVRIDQDNRRFLQTAENGEWNDQILELPSLQ